MRIYQHYLFPRLVDRLMGWKKFGELRREALVSATGRLLEIGCGSGLNIPLYPAPVTSATCIDSNPGMLRLASSRAEPADRPIHLVRCGAEGLPFDSSSFDTIVTTWTMCSIAAVEKALAEVRRVLKPGGQFLFVEHGLSPDPGVARWQNRLTPIQRRIGDGCHLNRDIEGLLREAGFQIERLRQDYLDGAPRIMGFISQGRARIPD